MKVESGLAFAIILGIHLCYRRGDTYVRIYWMYRPEDLPRGREQYHGTTELVASNHSIVTCHTFPGAKLTSLVDIIPAKSVVKKAEVDYFIDGENEPPNGLYWRQALDVRTGELSVSGPWCFL